MSYAAVGTRCGWSRKKPEALLKRDGVRRHQAKIGQGDAGRRGQAESYGHPGLSHRVEGVLHEQIHGALHRARQGVLHGNDTQVRVAAGNGREQILEGPAGPNLGFLHELQGRLVAERAQLALNRDAPHAAPFGSSAPWCGQVSARDSRSIVARTRVECEKGPARTPGHLPTVSRSVVRVVVPYMPVPRLHGGTIALLRA